jgi:hypothetical protein
MTAGFGSFELACPEGGAHEWVAGDPLRHCAKCNVEGRSFFREATAARVELFSQIKCLPASCHGAKPRERS